MYVKNFQFSNYVVCLFWWWNGTWFEANVIWKIMKKTIVFSWSFVKISINFYPRTMSFLLLWFFTSKLFFLLVLIVFKLIYIRFCWLCAAFVLSKLILFSFTTTYLHLYLYLYKLIIILLKVSLFKFKISNFKINIFYISIFLRSK